MQFSFYSQSVIIILYFISFISSKTRKAWKGKTLDKFLLWFFIIDGFLYTIGYIGIMFKSIFYGAWYDYILCFITISVFIYGFVCSRKKDNN